MKFVDWLARTAMLVLAGLATLALIGSLASVSNSPIADAFPGPLAVQDIAAPSEAPPASTGGERSTEPAPDAPTATMQQTVERAADARDREAARWLRALTYAVIALAAIAAAGVVALVRICGHLARVAER